MNLKRSVFHKLIILLVVLGGQTACKTTQPVETPTPTPTPTPTTTSIRLIDTSKVLNQSFTGLMIYDLDSNRTFLERNTDRYFIPASITKLFTYYACVKILKDSIPALKYKIMGDSLILWGTGDPTFLHPDFNNLKVYNFLKQQSLTKKIFISDAHFSNPYFGEGWAWDDYNDYYSTELSSFPMYGNIVRVNVQNKKTTIQPRFFEPNFLANTEGGVIKRNNFDNQFFIPSIVSQKTAYQQDLPYKTSTLLTQNLLADTLKKSVGILKLPVAKDALTIYSVPTEGVYRQMLQDSDNMLAEHLLLLCGSVMKDSVNSALAIKGVSDRFLQDLPDAPSWVDGSGLSRYNLFTPRSYVKLLLKLYAIVPREKLLSVMAIGGKAGTLKNAYVNNGKPFMYAKTGSMSGVYNLSGYLVTKKGKTMAFCVMNNNFTKPVRDVRLEVERILTTIYEQN
jgi:serine-type D-Ala-D-Ala carboxypeptidase/endopeptidase (penicillin-binding protein 4)